MNLKRILIALCLLSFTGAWASSLRLVNDSPYPLRLAIRGGDNSFLGELVLSAQHAITWTDVRGYGPNYSGPAAEMQQGSKSKTPYTVIWYCMDGSDFGVSPAIATGGLVTASSSEGTRSCKPQKKETSVGQQKKIQPQGHFLHQEPPPAQSSQTPATAP